MSKNTPLLPLEYCRIDRAARFLGCEVEDILHWGATSKISLRIHADHRPFGTPPSDMPVTSKSPVIFTGYLLPEIQGLFRDGGKFPVSNNASLRIDPSEENVGRGGILDERLCIAEIKGIWRVPNTAIELIYHGTGGSPFPVYEPYFRKLSNQSGGDGCFTVIGYICEQHDLAQVKNQLIIMADDLALLHKHIASGDPLPVNRSVFEADSKAKAIASSAKEIKPKVTANQSKAIVELLTAHGFTEEDYRGGIEALKQKIASKGLSGTLVNVDKNTLTDWLRKAGVR